MPPKKKGSKKGSKKGGKKAASAKGSSKGSSKGSKNGRSRSKSSKKSKRGKTRSRSRSGSRAKTPEVEKEPVLRATINHGPRAVLDLSYTRLMEKLTDTIIEIAIPSIAHWLGLREIRLSGHDFLDGRRFVAAVMLAKSKSISNIDLSYNRLGEYVVAAARPKSAARRPGSAASTRSNKSNGDASLFYTVPPPRTADESLITVDGFDFAPPDSSRAEEEDTEPIKVKLVSDPLFSMFSIPSLTKLDLSGNALDTKCAERIAKGLDAALSLEKNHKLSLRVLILAKNQIESAGLIAIVKALALHEGLQELDVSTNGIDVDGAAYMADLLRKKHALQSLNSLRVVGNDLSDRGVDLLCEAVINRPAVAILMDHVTLNRGPYFARKRLEGLEEKRQLEMANKLQHTLKVRHGLLIAKRQKEWQMMQLEDTTFEMDRVSSKKSSRKSSRAGSKSSKKSKSSKGKRSKAAPKAKSSKKGKGGTSAKKGKGGKKGTKDKATKGAAKKGRGESGPKTKKGKTPKGKKGDGKKKK